MRIRRLAVRTVVVVALLLAAWAAYHAWQVIEIGAAYKAKILCSSVFVSGRPAPVVLDEDLAGPLGLLQAEIDPVGKSVSASFFGAGEERALFREGFGCTVLAGAMEDVVRRQTSVVAAANDAATGRRADLWGTDRGSFARSPAAVARLGAVVAAAFVEPDANRPVRTRAVIVVHDGDLVVERYAPGISWDTPLMGWWMSKSVVNTLIGVLVQQGRLQLEAPVRLAAWSAEADPRGAITLDHLLRMSSGLEFDERSGPVVSDVNLMLLRSADTAAYAAAMPLRHPPGTRWHYSSGTTNILSALIRERMGGDLEEYLTFPRRALFDRIGMHSAVMELDAAGNFVGSSFMYATARDWARFGLLYLQDGIWNGERVLPRGWVTYSVTPTPAVPQGRYGAHFWTNGGSGTAQTDRPLPRLPPDTFYASGFEGQYIVIVPSREVVVVRLGQTADFRAWNMEAFVADVLAALAS